MERLGVIRESESESNRFACSVGRVALGTRDAALIDGLVAELPASRHDLIILRYPARWVEVFDRLTRVGGYRCIFADTLLYFEWTDSGEPLECSRPTAGAERVAAEAVGGLIEEIFADYTNHYSANPQLDRGLVAAGYAEWATGVALDPRNEVVAVMEDGDVAGLAVVDTCGDEWDIVLAGVRPDARGRGAYGDLIVAAMERARSHGRSAVRISTQSHHAQVMRTWERLGWRITDAFVTVHLQRDRQVTAPVDTP